MPRHAQTIDEYIGRNIDRTGDCWIWTGSHNGHYGCARFKRQRWLAHRLAWELAFGPIPVGMKVCHTCDTPLCCRPDHLFLGTQADNLADMQQKGRDAFTGDRHLLRRRPERRKAGALSHLATLTLNQVVEIRERYALGTVTQRKLADEYGIGRDTVGKIVRGETWRQELLQLTGQIN